MRLYLLEEPKVEKYIALISYAFNKNNILTFEIRNLQANEEEYNKKFNLICKIINEDRENILKEYITSKGVAEKIIDRICNKLQLYKNQYKEYSKSLIGSIFSIAIEKVFYDEKVKNVLEELKQDLIKIERFWVKR